MMLVQFPGARGYLLGALESAPDLFGHLLQGLSDKEADFRPDNVRFSLREVMAHLADWEQIFLERMKRTREEDNPFLEDIDEGQRALDLGYARMDVLEQGRLFRERRGQMGEFLGALSVEEWERPCLHSRVGPLTLEALATLVELHDAYHVRQVVEWRRLYAKGKGLK